MPSAAKRLLGTDVPSAAKRSTAKSTEMMYCVLRFFERPLSPGALLLRGGGSDHTIHCRSNKSQFCTRSPTLRRAPTEAITDRQGKALPHLVQPGYIGRSTPPA